MVAGLKDEYSNETLEAIREAYEDILYVLCDDMDLGSNNTKALKHAMEMLEGAVGDLEGEGYH